MKRSPLTFTRPLVLAFGLLSATAAFTHPCTDMILLEDGSLDREVIEDWFGELQDVSHVVPLGALRISGDVTYGTEEILDQIYTHLRMHADTLPEGISIFFSGLSDGTADDLIVSCPRGLATCNAESAKVTKVTFADFKEFYAIDKVEIQRPDTSTAPIVRVPLNRFNRHYCNFGLTSRSNSEPVLLLVFETWPVINPIKRMELSLNQDPTPSQFAGGVYFYNFQLELGYFDDFNR